MNIYRFSILALLTLAFIGYAHSEQQPTGTDGGELYESHNLFTGNCALKVRRQGNSWTYAPTTYSKTRFKGYWPTTPGVALFGSSVPTPNVPEVGPNQLLETLDVQFSIQPDGTLAPVAYVYDKVTHAAIPSPLLGPQTCSGLELKK